MPILLIPAAAVAGWFGGLLYSDTVKNLLWVAVIAVLVFLYIKFK